MMVECCHQWRNLSTGYKTYSQPTNPSLADNINYKYYADWDAALMSKFEIPGEFGTAGDETTLSIQNTTPLLFNLSKSGGVLQ